MTVLSSERTGRITASRVPLILGLSPYGGPQDAMRAMVRAHFGAPADPSSEAMDRGNRLEDEALAAYEAATGQLTQYPGRFTVHPTVSWLGATPDAYVGLSGLVQIKCPWRARYTHIDEKPDYAAQMQCEMACTGRKYNDLFVYRGPDDWAKSTLVYDPGWLVRNEGELFRFLEEFQDVVQDPDSTAPYLAPLSEERSDADWLEAAADWLDISTVLGQAKADLEDARNRLTGLVTNGTKSTRGGGVVVSSGKNGWSVRKAREP